MKNSRVCYDTMFVMIRQQKTPNNPPTISLYGFNLFYFLTAEKSSSKCQINVKALILYKTIRSAMLPELVPREST